MSDVVLRVESLATEFTGDEATVRVVDGISFELATGTTLGIVGESGCGKSVTALSIMGLLPKPAGRVVDGRILLNDDESPAGSQSVVVREGETVPVDL